MKKLILLALIGASVSATAQVRSRPKVAKTPTVRASLPIFSFMGDDTETPTTRTMLNDTPCTNDGNLTKCDDYKYPKLGGANLKWLSTSFNNKLLYQVVGSTWTNSYSTILYAFSAKYGKPQIQISKWQAKSGAEFDNQVATWAFKGGQLELSSLGTDLDSSLFTFSSTVNAPPQEKPKIDF